MTIIEALKKYQGMQVEFEGKTLRYDGQAWRVHAPPSRTQPGRDLIVTTDESEAVSKLLED